MENTHNKPLSKEAARQLFIELAHIIKHANNGRDYCFDLITDFEPDFNSSMLESVVEHIKYNVGSMERIIKSDKSK